MIAELVGAVHNPMPVASINVGQGNSKYVEFKSSPCMQGKPTAISSVPRNSTSRNSTMPNTAAMIDPATSPPQTSESFHLRSGASRIANTEIATAAPIRAAPSESIRGASLSPDGATVHAKAKITTPTMPGAQKIECQSQKRSSRPEPSMSKTPP